MTRRERRRSAGHRPRRAGQSPSYAPIITLLIVGIATVAGIIGLFVLLGDGDKSPPGEILEPTAEDHVLGEPTAPVTVVEYADYQCPFCRQFARTAGKQIIDTYVDAGQVRFVFRNFAFLGDESVWAAEAAECAAEQGAFWEYHDKLFDEWQGENIGAFSKTNLKRFASDLGLDAKAFNACLDSGKYEGKVLLEKVEADENQGISSTPTVFINGRLVKGGQSFEKYQEIIDRELSTTP